MSQYDKRKLKEPVSRSYFGSSSYLEDEMKRSASFADIGSNERTYSQERYEEDKEIPDGNPDPARYEILKSEIVYNFLVILIHYPNCTNYEGKKVLVFRDVRLADLIKQKLIDPHFSENKKYYSPIARFEPTDVGWDNAISFCKVAH
jgi:hypothetical protein